MESERFSSYEEIKQAIRSKNGGEYYTDEDEAFDELIKPRRRTDLLGITMVGTGVLIGGGVGLLAGIATIAVSASVAEVVLGGVVTKIAGVVGGAAGLGWGVNKMSKKKQKNSGRKRYE
jgi:hypothetical protein